MFRKQIEKAIDEALKFEKFPKVAVEIKVPPEERFGDYSTNVALKIASFKNNQSPGEIAKSLVPRLQKTVGISKIAIVDPGFINFFLDPKLIHSNTQKIIEQNQKFGSSSKNKGKKALVEFVSANPTGPLHIGNARGGPLGDTIASVLEFTGYKVTREYYDNDVGTQIDIFGDSLINAVKAEFGLSSESSKKVIYSGEFMRQVAIGLKSKLAERGITRIEGDKFDAIKKAGISSVFEGIIKDLKAMGIEFDDIQHESELQEKKETTKILEILKSKKVTKEKEGALWFVPRESSAQSQEFLEDRESVLVRSNGSPTYFADDIAYHKKKFETKANLIINVLGSNHHGHVPRLVAAIKALGFDASIYKVVLYQYVRLKKGKDIVKMSKRSGDVVTAREVLKEVGKDAFRFFLLSHSPNTHMDFDLELAKEQSVSNPVYYVQYAHARASNILKNAQKEGFSLEKFSKSDLSVLSEPQELTLAKKLQRLPELVEDTSKNLSVHQLTTYLIEVADLFHKYYEKYRVLGEKDELVKARLNLVLATKITLANTLRLIGVSAPERM